MSIKKEEPSGSSRYDKLDEYVVQVKEDPTSCETPPELRLLKNRIIRKLALRTVPPENHFPQSDLRKLLEYKKSYTTPRKRSGGIDTEHISKRRRLSFGTQKFPRYKDYQLLGDSQFVRFSEQILGLTEHVSRTDTYSRYIGFCVSGQKIESLKERLTDNDYSVHSHVVMLIGTNDILYSTDLRDMCADYKEILDNLRKHCEKIVLLSVPPVPKVADDDQQWEKLDHFNKFIAAEADGKQTFFVNLYGVLVDRKNDVLIDFFERTFQPSERPDLIHLNKNGFRMLKFMLDMFYFEIHESSKE